MKYRIIQILILIIFIPSCSNTFIGKRFIYYDYNKELDLELVLYKDSTFVLKDEYGCKRMSQKGKWKKIISNFDSVYSTQTFILTDTINPKIFIDMFNRKFFSYKSNYNNQDYTIREDYYFPLVSQDTIVLLDNKKLIFRKLTFNIEKGDIEKKRVSQAEKFYIDTYGKHIYIKVIGEGISIEKARENLKKCK